MRPATTQDSLGICPVWAVFDVRMKKPWVLSYTLSTQWRLWSDCEDVQADLSLHWARLEPDRSATEESYSLEILDIASTGITVFILINALGALQF